MIVSLQIYPENPLDLEELVNFGHLTIQKFIN